MGFWSGLFIGLGFGFAAAVVLLILIFNYDNRPNLFYDEEGS